MKEYFRIEKLNNDMSTNKGWESFKEFIEVANENCNWLVLRNFEYLPNNFFGNDKDVDVLCENIEKFTNKMNLKKRSWGIAAYETTINNKVVPFDIRFLGDGYYDKLWQYKMLENKIHTSNGVPRMNDEDYLFSLIYHSKIQKYEVKEVYKTRFYDLAKSLGITDYKIDSIENDTYIAELLSHYMKRKYYSFSIPVDVNVPKNEQFFILLDEYVKHGVTYHPPPKASIFNYIPNSILGIFPRSLKSSVKNILYGNGEN